MHTLSETQIKKHNVSFIAKQARDVLHDRGVTDIDFRNLPHDVGQTYSTKEASDHVQRLIQLNTNYRTW